MMQEPFDTEKTIAREYKPTGYALAAGSTLGQYRIIRPLGRGGMGEVYEVEHETLGLRYALKLLPTDFAGQPGALERFRREARVMAQLQHPNILKVDEFGETEGRYWLRMELAAGVEEGRGARGEGGGQRGEVRGTRVSLQDLAEAKGGRIPQEELVEILKQILEGLAYAHGHGAIHRDLKPSNILFSGGTVKIADFGLVRLVGEEWVRSQAQLSVQRSMSMGDLRTLQKEGEGTSTRSMLGTYEYMSPEQKRGEEATVQSDLYAVGLMAFKLLTGQNPGLKPPSRIVQDVADGWDNIVEKALDNSVQDRWADAKAMQGRLERMGLEIRQKESTCQDEARRAEATRREESLRRLRAEAEARLQEDERRRREDAARNRREAEAAAKKLENTRRIEANKPEVSNAWIWILAFAAVVGGGLWAANREPEKMSQLPEIPVTPGSSRTEPAAGTVMTVDLGGGVKLDLVWVAPGSFRMGSENRKSNENPVREVQITKGFWMGRTEVTQAQYEQVMGNNPSNSKGADLPVENVNWQEANRFCFIASQILGTEVRLPSEAEWEFAARGGNMSRGYEYSGGLNQDVQTWYGTNCGMKPHAAGTKEANELGLYDMHGNVWEWCEDWYHDNYGGAPLDGSPWLSPSGSVRVVRGGSWGLDARLCRSAERFGGSGHIFTGFRVVMSR